MTAPYRDPDALPSGAVLRTLEHAQRMTTEVSRREWLPFDWLPDPAPRADEEPTLVVDWAGLRSLSAADQARAARPPLTLVRWPADDAPPYASTARRRYVQRGAWLREAQERAGGFQDLAAVLLLACLLVALWLFVAALASWVTP